MQAAGLRWLLSLLCVAGLGLAGIAPAQQVRFRAGDKIEYKAQSYPETWATGTFVRDLPGGKQVLIRELPTQFFPEGFERAYALDEVRAPGSAGPPLPAVGANSGVAAPPALPPLPGLIPGAKAPGNSAASPAATSAAGGAAVGGPLSEQDVLAFPRTRLGDGDPFRNPRREAALQSLRDEVLRRGVSFRKQAIGEFANQLGKYGALSNVTSAMQENYGSPAAATALYGKWRLAKVGATTTFQSGGDQYRRMEYGGDAGSVTIQQGGTYQWDSPSGALRGSWRRATADEMAKSDKGGDGIVLLKAKSGADWLVMARNEEGPQGVGVKLTDLATRNLRERGTR